MEDRQYLICLIGLVGCSICSPVYCVRTLKGASPVSAIMAALSVTLGLAVALLFRNTKELAWLFVAAQVYFVTILLSTILYGVGKLLKAREKPE